MAQKYLAIKNYDKFQHYKHRNPPWIKLYNSLLDDYAFSQLPTRGKYLYLGLLILCSRHANRVPNDCTWIANALHMHPTEIDLKPLYRSGLLLASRNHVASMLHTNALSETEKSRDRVETETEREGASAPPPPPVHIAPRKKRPIPLPDDFKFTPTLREWALAKGCKEPFAEYERFCSKAVSKGWVYVDWSKAYQNWVLNELKWQREKANV